MLFSPNFKALCFKKENFCQCFASHLSQGSTVYKGVGMVTTAPVAAVNGVPTRDGVFLPAEKPGSEGVRKLPKATQSRMGPS